MLIRLGILQSADKKLPNTRTAPLIVNNAVSKKFKYRERFNPARS